MRCRQCGSPTAGASYCPNGENICPSCCGHTDEEIRRHRQKQRAKREREEEEEFQWMLLRKKRAREEKELEQKRKDEQEAAERKRRREQELERKRKDAQEAAAARKRRREELRGVDTTTTVQGPPNPAVNIHTRTLGEFFLSGTGTTTAPSGHTPQSPQVKLLIDSIQQREQQQRTVAEMRWATQKAVKEYFFPGTGIATAPSGHTPPPSSQPTSSSFSSSSYFPSYSELKAATKPVAQLVVAGATDGVKGVLEHMGKATVASETAKALVGPDSSGRGLVEKTVKTGLTAALGAQKYGGLTGSGLALTKSLVKETLSEGLAATVAGLTTVEQSNITALAKRHKVSEEKAMDLLYHTGINAPGMM